MFFVFVFICVLLLIAIIAYKPKKESEAQVESFVNNDERVKKNTKPLDYELYAHKWKQRISSKLSIWLEFDYSNQEGIQSKGRSVELNWINRANHRYLIEGFCERDQIIKSFYLERMSNIVNQETGEIFEDEEIVKYANWDSEGLTEKITIIEILFLLAKVDGRLKPRETKIIKTISDEICLNEEIFNWLKKLRRVEYEEFKNTLNIFLEDNEQSRENIYEYIKRVFKADEDISDVENNILKDLNISL